MFIVFFSIGTAALAVSILCNDLLTFYRNRQLLKEAEESLKHLESLNNDYDVLLASIRDDPNFIRRAAFATLGTRPEGENTLYPKAAPQQRAAARDVLLDTRDLSADRQDMLHASRPYDSQDWIIRVSQPFRRIVLFLAGAFLVLISFIWFGGFYI